MAEQEAPKIARVGRHLSGTLMKAVRHAYSKCLEDKASGEVYIQDDNSYSNHAVEAYILSVAALEAFIHELVSGLYPPGVKSFIKVDDIERWDIKQKYLFVPLMLWRTTYDNSKEPFQSFDALVKVRNDFVHYKMPFYEIGQGPSYLKTLESRKVVLSGQLFFSYVDMVSTSKGALWAHNTACRMVHELEGFADDITKRFLSDSVKSFQEIRG